MVDLGNSRNEIKYHLLFVEPPQQQKFKTKVCMPYFVDIFQDLLERSDSKSKGINRITLLNYS
jgi:hypothetical protein